MAIIVITSNGELAFLPLGMAIQTLVDHVGRFRCASFALSRSSLVSLFSYLCRILLFYGYGYYGTYWTYGHCSMTGPRRLCREVVDQGHRPKERFLVLVLLGRVNYRVPGFTCLSEWVLVFCFSIWRRIVRTTQ